MARLDRDFQHASGFTLVEMLLVLVLIGIISGAIAVSLSGRAEEARITRAKADLSGDLSLALDLFEQDVGRYPTADEGLDSLVRNPGIPDWKGPYVKGSELKPDPWGTPYTYAIDPQNDRQYILSSSGPDRQAGTEDDIRG